MDCFHLRLIDEGGWTDCIVPVKDDYYGKKAEESDSLHQKVLIRSERSKSADQSRLPASPTQDQTKSASIDLLLFISKAEDRDTMEDNQEQGSKKQVSRDKDKVFEG